MHHLWIALGDRRILVGWTFGVSDLAVDSLHALMVVIVPLQSLIANSQLLIPAGRSKASLLGFYDCAISEKKRLYCKYSFKGRLHEFTVDDSAGVAAPMRGKLLVSKSRYLLILRSQRTGSSSLSVAVLYAYMLEYYSPILVPIVSPRNLHESKSRNGSLLSPLTKSQ